MMLTNYWLMLIWLVIVGGILAFFAPRIPVQVLGKTEYLWNRWAALFLACPYIIWAANRRYFGDTEVYRSTFRNLPMLGDGLFAYLTTVHKDPGFPILSSLMKCFIGSNDVLFFFIIATFQMCCIVYFFRKYSTNFLLCMFMFIVSTDYLSWMFNGMRQFIACCIALCCFGLILKKKYISIALVIIFASTIHKSVLIMLPLTYVIQGKAWNRKTLLMIMGTIVAILFVAKFTSLLGSVLANTQYNDMLINGIWEGDDGTNILRSFFYSIPAMLAFIGRKQVDAANSDVVNLCVNCSICTAALYFLSSFTSGIYIGRLPIYTTLQSYAVVPWLISHTFAKQTAKLATAALVGAYLVFFFYQMHFVWNAI